ncbi:MAG: pirin family protein [Steroidobacteraceae bacterium]
MISFRDRMARGTSRTGWLDSRHTFSFAEYRDPQHIGFRSLRVVNEDRVIPGAGFPLHSHRDMDIISYVLEGTLEHKDSLGNGARIRPGEVQCMSAGRGITHSEFNPSKTDPVHFLQIWIIPDQRNLPPSYEQKEFPIEERSGRLRLVAAADARGGAVKLHQDARLFLASLRSGEKVMHAVEPGRGLWVQVARGIVRLNGTEMREGDGAAVEDVKSVEIEADTDGEVLVFDLGCTFVRRVSPRGSEPRADSRRFHIMSFGRPLPLFRGFAEVQQKPSYRHTSTIFPKPPRCANACASPASRRGIR